MKETNTASCGDIDRLEERLRECDKSVEKLFDVRITAMEKLSLERYGEIRRRLDDLNNSHEKAVDEKRRTDEAALRVQERTVPRVEFQAWKDDVGGILATQAGAQTARAAMLSSLIGILVLVINVVIRYLSK